MVILRIITGSLLLCLLSPLPVAAQDADSTKASPPPPCSSPEFRQFDFWVGTWDLTWADTGRGQNVITQELDNCVIEENFTTLGEGPFRGNSVSTFDVKTGQWHQTWVDNQGGYYAFEGGMVGDSMILGCEKVGTDGTPFKLRMVFHNIKENSLDWSWERSDDRGKTWRSLWAIHYERRL